MRAHALRRRLAAGGVAVGSWLSLGSVDVAEILADAGFDFLVVDLQHSATDLSTTAAIMRVVEHRGCHPLVRIPSVDPPLIGRLLDAGAHGIIVPDVRTVEEAVRAVAASRFPPAGRRGTGLYRAQGYGSQFGEYRQHADDGVLIIAQIESRAGVQVAGSIGRVPGVDALMVGPYDLSASLGVTGDFGSAAYREALLTLHAAASQSGIVLGYHIVEPDVQELDARYQEGYRFLVHSVDMRMLDVTARVGVQAGRQLA